MLFQPTNITPSAFAGVGGDLVLDGSDLNVTWQVNGTSPMTAYQITVYSNDAASTQLYTTGKVTLASPFYGVDGMGEVQLFTATIGVGTLMDAGIVTGNANGYKYKITQWWSADDYIEQSAENYFIIQQEPAYSIDTTSITAPSASIAGSWEQTEGVGMDWVRWVIELADPETNLSTGTVLIDTGKIHTQLMEFTYDGWISGTAYSISLSFQLQNGFSASTSTVITASWAQAEMRATATAMLTNGCANALVTYPMPTYAEITATPTAASVSDGVLNITSASETLEWNGGVMTGSPVIGGLVWSGIPNGTVTMSVTGAFTTAESGTLYRDNTLQIELDPTTGTITWTAIGDDEDETGDFSIEEDISGKLVTVIAVGSEWHEIVQSPSVVMLVAGATTRTRVAPTSGFSINGTPVTDIHAIQINSDTYDLQEFDDQSSNVAAYSFNSPLTGGVSVWPDNADLTLAGLQECRYFGFLSTDYAETTMDTLMSGDGEQPEFTPDWLYLSNWEDDGYTVLGSMPENTTQDTPQTNSIIVYRREDGAPVMEKIFAISGQENMDSRDIGKIIDYAVVSGKNYTYSVYYAYEDGNGGTSFSMMVSTGSVSPCYWDWILTAAERNEDGTYRVTGSYRFGLNLETGAMSNNNAPTLMTNFTRYPTRQGVSANYRSGSLTAFIGTVDAENNIYVDTEAQAEAIFALGASTDTKFLRNRKGSNWMVDTAAATMVQVGDKYKEQPYTATLSWVETGSTDGVSVISVPTDAAWPM